MNATRRGLSEDLPIDIFESIVDVTNDTVSSRESNPLPLLIHVLLLSKPSS
jgi:hypothetical protein